ncbi:hypothetical protein NDU88_000656 [Pleurodeles waltl]|uniref:Uncharacterized protein n=1 Tax=Pleurodeles waltl TaxID=8319 RepID=A0AAV7S597_PLEWA|nr:hypothetical protein NDU88_000656 [Pleurodeles waltl]
MGLYPTRLCIISGGKSHFFDTLEDVWWWLETWDKVYKDKINSKSTNSSATQGPQGAMWRRKDDILEDNSLPLSTGESQIVIIQEDGTMAIDPVDQVTLMEASLQDPVRDETTGPRLLE